MSREVLWFLIVLILWATLRILTVAYAQCMDSCVAQFKGAYPEIACKYECSFFNKFKKPLKAP